MISNLEEDIDLLLKDKNPTDEEKKIASDIADVISLLKEQEKPNGKCVNECECWDAAYERGKQDALKEQEAVEGHWIPIESPTGVEAFGIKEMTVQDVRCSVCDTEEDVSFVAYRFCPRCGAKMEGR